MTTHANAALTRAEHQLRTAFSAGLPLDLTTASAQREPGGGSANPTGTLIHAWVIRDLLLCNEPVAAGKIRQLSITGASIEGELDLRFARSDCPLRLEDCTFDSPVTLTEAHLRSVSLRKSTIPGIDARHVTITGDLVLDDVHLSGCLQISGAHLGDDLHLARATIDPPARAMDGGDGASGHGDVLLDLENIEVRGCIDAREIKVHGKVSTLDATVAGPVRMMKARILPAVMAPAGAPESTVVWSGDGMKVEGSLDASGLRASGQVRLVDTRVLCLVFRNVHIKNPGIALVLDRLYSEGSAFCDQRSNLIGGLHAIGIQVGATLYLGHGLVKAPAVGNAEDRRHAVDLRRAKIAGELKCTAGFQAIGACNLSGAHIGGRVSLPGATLQSAGGAADQAALIADGAHIDGSVHFKDGFTCQGTIGLVNAQVGGEFTVEQDRQESGNRCTVAAAGLSVARDVKLDVAGKVDLRGADIAGDLTLRLQRLSAGEDHAAANLGGVSADTLTLRGRPLTGLLDLTRAKVSLLRHSKEDWAGSDRIVLEGLEYCDITTAGAKGDKEIYAYRLKWLEEGTQWAREGEDEEGQDEYAKVGFTPQPYQQLAEVYRSAGKDREARRVLHTMYRRHASTNSWRQPFIRIWNGAQDIFVGYGYRPDLTIAWVIALTVVAALMFGHIGQHHAGVVQEILMSLGLLLPESAYNRIEPWHAAGTTSHVVAAFLVLCGLLLSATVIAAVARVIKE
jgi:hypothetical protein